MTIVALPQAMLLFCSPNRDIEIFLVGWGCLSVVVVMCLAVQLYLLCAAAVCMLCAAVREAKSLSLALSFEL